MDPDENLKAQRTLAQRLVEQDDPDPAEVLRLSELVIALDDWIKSGGFLPAAWRR
jgi:hypothetical protein